MSTVRYLFTTLVETLLRVLPFPTKTGLIKIGNPDRQSPVLVTCNFRLTVERVKRALAGTDAYLLVANSRGVNVWCAATGGLLTNHDVISVVKTSGIDEFVDHRRLILPQLAATGIEGEIIHKKTGWQVLWGPIRAEDVPRYMAAHRNATQEMRTVRFPWQERLEMAVAWAFPISLGAGLIALPFLGWGVLALVVVAWGLSLVLFLAFPLYESLLRKRGKSHGFVFFDFGLYGLPLVFWALFMAGLVAYGAWTGVLDTDFVLRWGLSSLAVLLILSLDLMGSTPMYKSGLHGDRLLSIELDTERCKGAAFCETVCPTRVFEVDRTQHLAALVHEDACVQCGACIVQCPFDALWFVEPSGETIDPATIRRFKLNLLGKRSREAALCSSSTTFPGREEETSHGRQ